MTLILGNFLESLPQNKRAISISLFFNYDLSSEERLDDDSLLDLITNCITKFLYYNKNKDNSREICSTKESIDYITNELLENSIKYGDRQLPTIVIKFHVTEDKIFILSTNLTSKSRADSFKAHIHRMLNSDISEMYLRQIEDYVSLDNKSGLGFLSMINDYNCLLYTS
ncbi:hypothetical protein C8B47_30450, partial [filamentous cyanobacterium CCP4]